MEILLEAALSNGETQEVGGYIASMPPRIGERVQLYLNAGFVSRDGIELPNSHVVRFWVVGVTYIAHNTRAVEEWMDGHTHSVNNSSYALVEVRPDDDEARTYLARLAGEAK